MNIRLSCAVAWLLTTSALVQLHAQQSDAPRPIPLTRPELKKLIEDVKLRTPRIPLPELSESDRAQLGERAENYESRLRHHYLTGGDQALANRSTMIGLGGPGTRQGSARPQDPNNTLDYAFKVELFWIVSRTNNCQYCLGHQETKLLAAGLDEDRIARLDSDWQTFTPAERAAYSFARKYSYQPHLLSDEDIVNLKAYFTPAQILEMMLSMAGNNAINRWKEGVGVPQNAHEGGYSRAEATDGIAADSSSRPRGTYLTPTPIAYQKSISRVAPLALDANGQPTSTVICSRPPLESRAEVEQRLADANKRQSRLPLVDEATTRKLMALDDDQIVTPWLRLMANFPLDGVRRAQALAEVERNGDLNPRLKAQVAWIVARLDRAWYATHTAKQRLLELGVTEDEIYALDGDWTNFEARDRALFRLAHNLATSPVTLTDRQVNEALEQAGAAAVVQVINYVTHLAAFNRLTEAAGLPAN